MGGGIYIIHLKEHNIAKVINPRNKMCGPRPEIFCSKYHKRKILNFVNLEINLKIRIFRIGFNYFLLKTNEINVIDDYVYRLA